MSNGEFVKRTMLAELFILEESVGPSLYHALAHEKIRGLWWLLTKPGVRLYPHNFLTPELSTLQHAFLFFVQLEFRRQLSR
jgi:hypothetical protein